MARLKLSFIFGSAPKKPWDMTNIDKIGMIIGLKIYLKFSLWTERWITGIEPGNLMGASKISVHLVSVITYDIISQIRVRLCANIFDNFTVYWLFEYTIWFLGRLLSSLVIKIEWAQVFKALHRIQCMSLWSAFWFKEKISSTVDIPWVTHFLALKSCVTKGKRVTQGMSVRFHDIPWVTHVSQNCVTKGKFNAIFPLVTHVWAEKRGKNYIKFGRHVSLRVCHEISLTYP